MKDGYHVYCTVSSNFLLDKGRVAENLQKDCLCYLSDMTFEILWLTPLTLNPIVLYETSVLLRTQEPKTPMNYCDHALSIVPPSSVR